MGGSSVGKTALMEAACAIYKSKPTKSKSTSMFEIDQFLNVMIERVVVDFQDTNYELLLSTNYDTGLTEQEQEVCGEFIY